MDEQEAIKRLKNSDEKAFSFLYKSYWPKVNHFTRLYIIDTDSAEEIIQEVFIKLWEHRKELNESGSLDGYLFIITRNLIFNSSRQSFNHQFYQTTIIEAMEQSYNIDEELDAADLHAYINSIIEQPPPSSAGSVPPEPRAPAHLSRNSPKAADLNKDSRTPYGRSLEILAQKSAPICHFPHAHGLIP